VLRFFFLKHPVVLAKEFGNKTIEPMATSQSFSYAGGNDRCVSALHTARIATSDFTTRQSLEKKFQNHIPNSYGLTEGESVTKPSE
jgi:hypothetical protein